MHNALIAKSHENASRYIYTKCIIERGKKKTTAKTARYKRNEQKKQKQNKNGTGPEIRICK